MPRPVTDREKEILAFVRQQIQAKGFPPSIREIGKRFGIRSTNGVRTALQALERKGQIKRSPMLSRGIELMQPLTEALSPMFKVPIIGRVAAGAPLLAEQNIEGTVAVDRDLMSGENTFALRVKGDSMVGAGIFDGDLVFARPQGDFKRGEIVVAVIGEEATIKYFYPDNGRIRLEPANRFYGPIVVDRATPGFYIAGKVVGVFRKV
jgi:repressor LexA